MPAPLPRHGRRVLAIAQHTAAAASSSSVPLDPHRDLRPDYNPARSDQSKLVDEFAMRGMVVLGPEDLQVPQSLHRTVFDKEQRAIGRGGFILSRVPEVVDVINSPGLVAAADKLVGPGWAIVPFCHHATFASGGRDQHW